MAGGSGQRVQSEYYLGGYQSAGERLAITFHGSRAIFMTGSKKACEAKIAELYAGRNALPLTDLTQAMS